MKRILAISAAIALGAATPVHPARAAQTILFVGNSFTYGELSPVKTYKANTVSDMNRDGIGGVPALFKAFATESGLDYDVSLETVPGVGIDYHYENKRALLDRNWDAVVLQSFSTLDQHHPADPGLLTKYAALFSGMLHRRNAGVKIYLTATWSRADLTYPDATPWHGKPIEQMGKDVDAGYRAAAEKAPGIAGVIPVGLAWNDAMDTGLADPDPYDGIAPGEIDLWAPDKYHASAYGYYLEALLIFGRVTGKDPRSLGDHEAAARDLSLDPVAVGKLEQIAHERLAKN